MPQDIGSLREAIRIIERTTPISAVGVRNLENYASLYQAGHHNHALVFLGRMTSEDKAIVAHAVQTSNVPLVRQELQRVARTLAWMSGMGDTPFLIGGEYLQYLPDDPLPSIFGEGRDRDRYTALALNYAILSVPELVERNTQKCIDALDENLRGQARKEAEDACEEASRDSGEVSLAQMTVALQNKVDKLSLADMRAIDNADVRGPLGTAARAFIIIHKEGYGWEVSSYDIAAKEAAKIGIAQYVDYSADVWWNKDAASRLRDVIDMYLTYGVPGKITYAPDGSVLSVQPDIKLLSIDPENVWNMLGVNDKKHVDEKFGAALQAHYMAITHAFTMSNKLGLQNNRGATSLSTAMKAWRGKLISDLYKIANPNSKLVRSRPELGITPFRQARAMRQFLGYGGQVAPPFPLQSRLPTREDEREVLEEYARAIESRINSVDATSFVRGVAGTGQALLDIRRDSITPRADLMRTSDRNNVR